MQQAILQRKPHKDFPRYEAITVRIPMEGGFACTVKRVWGDNSDPTCHYDANAKEWRLHYAVSQNPRYLYQGDIASILYFFFHRLHNCMTYSLTVALYADGSLTTVASGFEMTIEKEALL